MLLGLQLARSENQDAVLDVANSGITVDRGASAPFQFGEATARREASTTIPDKAHPSGAEPLPRSKESRSGGQSVSCDLLSKWELGGILVASSVQFHGASSVTR